MSWFFREGIRIYRSCLGQYNRVANFYFVYL
jgi:hypothetical protein